MLFALRYEKEGRQQISSLMAKMQELGMGASVDKSKKGKKGVTFF